MTNLREASQMALDALYRFVEYDYQGNPLDGKDVEGHDAIEALRAALTQPEQTDEKGRPMTYWGGLSQPDAVINGMPVYEGSLSKSQRLAQPNHSENKLEMVAQPKQELVAWMERERAVGYREGHQAALKQREWQGLTDEEYEKMAEHYVTNCYFDTLKYARAIEAKLKEKNT